MSLDATEPNRLAADFTRSSSTGELSADVMDDYRRRLMVGTIVYAITFSLAYGVPRFVFQPFGPKQVSLSIADVVSIVAILDATILSVMLGYNKVPQRLLLLLSLWFLPVASLGIVTSEFWYYFCPDTDFRAIRGLSWVAVWMTAYPAMVPATAKRLLIPLLLSAASVPLIFVASFYYWGAPAAHIGELQIVLWGSTIQMSIVVVLAFLSVQLACMLRQRVHEARKLGAYSLIEVLGKGGMGEVWRAKHTLLARPAAVKLMRPDRLGEKAVKRFEREAQATARLRCPHTINLFDFGVAADGTFYYVMELLEGLDLEQMIARFGSLPPERVVYLIRQVCHSLEEAHRRGLIHRDIKPSNIYCCRYGIEVDFVKVLDFGLVKDFEGGVEATKLTLEGSIAGTPAYMAPEVALADTEIDARADLYAIGCVAFHMLTGQSVFEGDTPMRVVMGHISTPATAPSTLTEIPIPEALDALVLALLEKDPNARPQTAEEVMHRLDDIALDEPWTQKRALQWWSRHLPEDTQNLDSAFVAPSQPSF